jgi:hypothetical protein
MTRPARVLYVLPSIPDELDPEIKNALAVRNAAGTTGVCPCCRARGKPTRPDRLGFYHLTFRHESWCAALTDDGEVA